MQRRSFLFGSFAAAFLGRFFKVKADDPVVEVEIGPCKEKFPEGWRLGWKLVSDDDTGPAENEFGIVSKVCGRDFDEKYRSYVFHEIYTNDPLKIKMVFRRKSGRKDEYHGCFPRLVHFSTTGPGPSQGELAVIFRYDHCVKHV